MKKFNYLILGLAGIAMASCSQEEASQPAAAGDGNMHFTVNLPNNLTSRAESAEGQADLQLKVMVYEAVTGSDKTTTNNFLFEAENIESNGNGTFSVELALLQNKAYNIIFFAASSSALENVYAINEETGTLTVNYDLMMSDANSADAYNCFYNTYSTGTVGSGEMSPTVQLSRPVAQVNWGTTDLSDAINYSAIFGDEGAYIATTFSASNVPNTLDMFSGTASGESVVTFTDFAAPTGTYPSIQNSATTYNYLAMQYLLASKGASTNLDFTLTVTNKGGENTSVDYSNEITVSAAPVQANYQTNIYGSLLAPNATYSITKTQDWGNYNLSQGGIVEEPEKGDDGYEMESEGNFLWLAQQVYEGNDFYGEDFVLNGDVYLDGPIQPIGNNQAVTGGAVQHSFNGNFDGGGHTIYNVDITSTTYYTGLFGYTGMKDGKPLETPNTIKNLNIENLSVKGTQYVGGLIGYAGNTNVTDITINGNINIYGSGQIVGGLIGSLQNGAISDVELNGNITISGASSVGGFVGSMNQGSLSNLTITSTNGQVTGEYTVGGIVGNTIASNSNNSNITALSDLTANINVSSKKSSSAYTIGGISGNAGGGLVFTNCKYNGSLYVYATGANGYKIGGISGSWNNKSTTGITYIGCSSSGTISNRDGVIEGTNNIVGCAQYPQGTGYLYIVDQDATQPYPNVAKDHMQPGIVWEGN